MEVMRYTCLTKKKNKTNENEREREEREKRKKEVLNKYLGPEIAMKAKNNSYKLYGGAKRNKTKKKNK